MASAVRRGSAASQRSMSARCGSSIDGILMRFCMACASPMDDALLPPEHIIAEPLRERCCVRLPEPVGCCCRELAVRAPTRVPSSAWASLITASSSHRIERAIKLSKTPLTPTCSTSDAPVRAHRRCRNMIALDHFRALASLVLQLEGRRKKLVCSRDAAYKRCSTRVVSTPSKRRFPQVADDRAILLLDEA